jgi:hypothetical protein
MSNINIFQQNLKDIRKLNAQEKEYLNFLKPQIVKGKILPIATFKPLISALFRVI